MTDRDEPTTEPGGGAEPADGAEPAATGPAATEPTEGATPTADSTDIEPTEEPGDVDEPLEAAPTDDGDGAAANVDAELVADLDLEVDADVDLATDVTATDREAAANEAAERSRSARPRAVGLWAARALAGVACIAVALVGIRMGDALPSIAAEPRTELVVPTSPGEERVCAGPLVRLGDASGAADVVTVAATPTQVVSQGESTGLAFDGVDASATLLGGTALAGAETLAADDASTRGAAASECSEPSTSQWLVGGATSTGRTSVLTIANPGTAPTSVDVAVFGPEGRIEAVGSTGIAIPPRSASIIDLAALAPGLASPIVHVTSSGGPISARLQHTAIRGLEPGGMELVDPAAAARTLAIAGVVVRGPAGVETQEGYADLTPAMRILSAESTSVRITTTADGQEPIVSTQQVVGGQVLEIDLQGLAPGTYGFVLEADVPIVAGARQVRVDDGRVDVDWVTAASTPLDGATPLAVPAAPAGTDAPLLHLLSMSDEEQVVVVDGEEVVLAPAEQRTLPIAPGIHDLDATGVVAAVTYEGAGAVAGFTVTPRGAALTGIDVVL